MTIIGNNSRLTLGSIRYQTGGSMNLQPGNTAFGKPSMFFNARLRDGQTTFYDTMAYPTGYYPQGAYRMPVVAGEMGLQPIGTGTLSGNLYAGRLMTVDFTGSGTLSGTGSLAVSASIDMTGSGSLSATITGLLDGSVSFSGSGSLTATLGALADLVVSMTGTGDLDATIAAIGDMSVDMVVTGTGLTVENVGAAVWDILASAHNIAGTMGEKLNAAGTAGDPWTTPLPGSYISGTAGMIVGTYLDAAVSSRLSTSGYTAPDNTTITLIKKLLSNKVVTNSATGTITIYDDDNTTVIGTASIYTSPDTSVPYDGTAINRKDKLT